jgi:hypothetical protein
MPARNIPTSSRAGNIRVMSRHAPAAGIEREPARSRTAEIRRLPCGDHLPEIVHRRRRPRPG